MNLHCPLPQCSGRTQCIHFHNHLLSKNPPMYLLSQKQHISWRCNCEKHRIFNRYQRKNCQDIREAVDYGVIKMNIDTDTQHPWRMENITSSRIPPEIWGILWGMLYYSPGKQTPNSPLKITDWLENISFPIELVLFFGEIFHFWWGGYVFFS